VPVAAQLARTLGVSPFYVWKVVRKAATVGMDVIVKYGKRITLNNLAEARRFTAKLRQQEPDLFAPEPQGRASDEPRTPGTLVHSHS